MRSETSGQLRKDLRLFQTWIIYTSPMTARYVSPVVEVHKGIIPQYALTLRTMRRGLLALLLSSRKVLSWTLWLQIAFRGITVPLHRKCEGNVYRARWLGVPGCSKTRIRVWSHPRQPRRYVGPPQWIPSHRFELLKASTPWLPSPQSKPRYCNS